MAFELGAVWVAIKDGSLRVVSGHATVVRGPLTAKANVPQHVLGRATALTRLNLDRRSDAAP